MSEVTVTMTRTEALALVKVAETGLRVVEALGLIQNTGSAEKAVRMIEEELSRRPTRATVGKSSAASAPN